MDNYGYVPGSQGYDGEDDGGGGPERFKVELCSGETMLVMTEVEQRWFDNTKGKYLTETRFTDTTDLQDMDRLLCLELLMFRWNQYLANGYDYEQNVIDDDLIRKSIKEQSGAITAIKTQLGLDKKTREAALNEGNFSAWLADVKRRAKIFGVHRETQLNKALALMNELSGIVGAFDRSDLEERKKLGYESTTEIIEWVRSTMIPAFKAIDEHFVENEQKMWRRDL